MKLLPSQYTILFSLLNKPKGFNEIVKDTELSSATVDKWLKILEKMEYVKKKGKRYEITPLGVESLKTILTDITRKALDLGLVADITIAIITHDAKIVREGDDYVLHVTHYGDIGETRVRISLGDSKEDIISCLRRLLEELGEK